MSFTADEYVRKLEISVARTHLRLSERWSDRGDSDGEAESKSCTYMYVYIDRSLQQVPHVWSGGEPV